MRLTGKEIVPVRFVTVLEYSKATSTINSEHFPAKERQSDRVIQKVPKGKSLIDPLPLHHSVKTTRF